MAYSDPQRARDAVRAWRKANPELVKQQRRAAILRKATRERRLPRLSSITRHGLSDEDIERIVVAVMRGRDESEMTRMVAIGGCRCSGRTQGEDGVRLLDFSADFGKSPQAMAHTIAELLV